MTSRDATRFLPRPDQRSDGRSRRQWLRDWTAVILLGAVQWPWLLRSLNGGGAERRIALLDRLGLPADALPHLGSWKADIGLLEILAAHILEARPGTVVEFGAGASTLIAARALERAGGGDLISFDQHSDFIEATRSWIAEFSLSAELRTATLRPAPDGWPGLWYEHGRLPPRIDLLLVDGPPWTIHPFTRGAASTLFDRIPVGGTVMLDDAARPGERLVARRWRREWPNFEFTRIPAGSKGLLIGTRLR